VKGGCMIGVRKLSVPGSCENWVQSRAGVGEVAG
jgi:hypothetical protein